MLWPAPILLSISVKFSKLTVKLASLLKGKDKWLEHVLRKIFTTRMFVTRQENIPAIEFMSQDRPVQTMHWHIYMHAYKKRIDSHILQNTHKDSLNIGTILRLGS